MKKPQEQAPDSQLNFADGSRERLSSYWRGGRLVLVFLRHLG